MRKVTAIASLVLVCISAWMAVEPANAYNYAVVVQNSTLADSAWAEVVDTLVARHSGQVFTYDLSIWETQAGLSAFVPDYVCFITEPLDATESFDRDCHQLTRALDHDIYGDAFWGIVTGYAPEDAMRVARISGFTIRTVLGGTNCCWLSWVYQGAGTFEAVYNRIQFKYPDGTIVDTTDSLICPTDRTEFLVDFLNSDSIDMFVTSGHASEHDWQLHYPTPGLEGYFKSTAGVLYGDPYGSAIGVPVNSTNSKIYFPMGNCSMGHVSDMDCMVLAWFHTAGACQYAGYIVPTWYGYMLWGLPAYFHRLQDRFTYCQAFYLNNQALLFDQQNNTPGTDPSGLSYDRDAVAFYGDPACSVYLEPEPNTLPLWDEETIVSPGVERDTMTVRVTMNHECRPGFTGASGPRHPIVLLPFRVESVDIIYTDAYQAVVTDNFVLLYCWQQGDTTFQPGDHREVVFTYRRMPGVNERPEAGRHPSTSLGTGRQEARLMQNNPNPFSHFTTIRYHLPARSTVSLTIYDITGRVVTTLVSGEREAGSHGVVFSTGGGFFEDEKGLSTGIYLAQLAVGNIRETKKMILIK